MLFGKCRMMAYLTVMRVARCGHMAGSAGMSHCRNCAEQKGVCEACGKKNDAHVMPSAEENETELQKFERLVDDIRRKGETRRKVKD